MAMWSDAVSPKIKQQMAQATVEGTEPTGEAQHLPDEVHIEQMRQWGFTVIPGVIPGVGVRFRVTIVLFGIIAVQSGSSFGKFTQNPL